jgi:hypothetical protein
VAPSLGGRGDPHGNHPPGAPGATATDHDLRCPILSSAQRLEVLTGVRPLPGQDPFPGADILYVHDRASYQAVITSMWETLGELGRDGAEHQAL